MALDLSLTDTDSQHIPR